VDVVVVVDVVMVGCTVEFEGAFLRFVVPARSCCSEKSSVGFEGEWEEDRREVEVEVLRVVVERVSTH